MSQQFESLKNNSFSRALSFHRVKQIGPALEDLEAPKRQASLDGEAIKIVIHDFDSGPLCATKRRIVIRRDPNDKGHRSEYNTPKTLRRSRLVRCSISFVCFYLLVSSRSAARGFGMRVVGGKTGADGKLFACVVWTVPGEKERLYSSAYTKQRQTAKICHVEKHTNWKLN